jgi:predicted DCC family thiol-disulfide oxidoreductase YuxK
MHPAHDKDVLFFDGECLFCQARIRWLIRRDRERALFFAPLQGELARLVLAGTGLAEAVSSMVFATRCLTPDQEISTKSTAASRIAARLSFPWRLGGLLVLIPRPWRNAAYDWVAKHRHALGGPGALDCPLPTAEERSRFFD